jgi:DnaJ-class molecular chaperone
MDPCCKQGKRFIYQTGNAYQIQMDDLAHIGETEGEEIHYCPWCGKSLGREGVTVSDRFLFCVLAPCTHCNMTGRERFGNIEDVCSKCDGGKRIPVEMMTLEMLLDLLETRKQELANA